VSPERIKENIEIFDFELAGEDVEAISALNRNERTGADPDKFDGRLSAAKPVSAGRRTASDYVPDHRRVKPTRV